MFESRKITPAQFIKEFFETLTPGVIPRQQFIDWPSIQSKCKNYSDAIEYFESIRNGKPSLHTELRDALLASDDPGHLLRAAFELLGHTVPHYVSDRDNIDIRQIAEKIVAGSEKTAATAASILQDLGLPNILASPSVQSAFLGVQVGLETHRRKSVGGAVFANWVHELLQSTCGLIRGCEIQPEVLIPYADKKNGKRVDFALSHKGQIKIGVEVNFYTTSGSKPSEIKRAYQIVNRELNRVGVELVWITDGAGYQKMRRSLEEAFRAHPNTYNYEMARRHLKQDVTSFLNA